MANFFRRLRQRFSDKEVGVLGEEIEACHAALLDAASKLDSLTERFERLQSKYGMRSMRARSSQMLEPHQERQHMSPAQRRDAVLEELAWLQEMERGRGGH